MEAQAGRQVDQCVGKRVAQFAACDQPAAFAGTEHMSASSTPVTIRILDRDYTVGVDPAERDGLEAAARTLDARMREIRGGNRTASVDRVAVLTALNLAHELLLLRKQISQQESDLQRTLAELNRRLDHALDQAP